MRETYIRAFSLKNSNIEVWIALLKRDKRPSLPQHNSTCMVKDCKFVSWKISLWSTLFSKPWQLVANRTPLSRRKSILSEKNINLLTSERSLLRWFQCRECSSCAISLSKRPPISWSLLRITFHCEIICSIIKSHNRWVRLFLLVDFGNCRITTVYTNFSSIFQ